MDFDIHSFLMIWIRFRDLYKGDTRESIGKLGSREHETLRFNLHVRKSNLGERWKCPDLILNGYLLKILLILCSLSL
jgi:hypothetical protein